jgi:hypothetical protein
VKAADDEIVAFLDRQLTQGCGYEDIRDHIIFDFNNEEDMRLFLREMRSTSPPVKVNVTLFGAEYLVNRPNDFFLL